MMSRHVTEPGHWGEDRLATREAERRRRGWNTVGWIVLVPVVLGFANAVRNGFRAGAEPSSAWGVSIAAAALVALMVVGLWRMWRHDDEVGRRISLNSLATVGITSLLLNPLADILAPRLATDDLRHPIWWISAAAGVLAFAWQRWRP